MYDFLGGIELVTVASVPFSSCLPLFPFFTCCTQGFLCQIPDHRTYSNGPVHNTCEYYCTSAYCIPPLLRVRYHYHAKIEQKRKGKGFFNRQSRGHG